jgi:spermidine/putrescine-binding protein
MPDEYMPPDVRSEWFKRFEEKRAAEIARNEQEEAERPRRAQELARRHIEIEKLTKPQSATLSKEQREAAGGVPYAQYKREFWRMLIKLSRKPA